MHDGMPCGRNQGQGQGHSREVDRQSPTGLIFSCCKCWLHQAQFSSMLLIGYSLHVATSPTNP